MKCTIPEISWHNRDPVLSVDIQLKQEKDNFYRIVTGGADSHVFIWYLTEGESGIANVEFASDLSRHQKAVNVVRFSPDGQLLASGDDESVIFVWKQRTDQDLPEFPSSNLDEENINKEHWIVSKILRGHVDDVYDLSWAPTSDQLISGSVDNSAILWNVQKGKKNGILKEHKKFVQGVAWDPKNQYVATLSSDRSMRTYSLASKKVISRATRAKLPLDPSHELHDKLVPLFHDDTMKSFFRRLDFSPDGQLLVAPSGVLETQDKKPTSVTHVFTRACLNKPAVCLPSLQYYSVAVKCCPVLFELKSSTEVPLFKLPYRMVIAVATENNILLYDTQHATPFAFIANIHYTKLTDITWSSDGRILIASSTDGYCSIISFAEKEIGTLYVQSTADEGKENTPSGGKMKSDSTPVDGKDSSDSTNTTGHKTDSEKPNSTCVPKSEAPNVLTEKPAVENVQHKVKKIESVPEVKVSCRNEAPAVPVDDMEVDTPAPKSECPTTPKTPNKSSGGCTPSKTPRRVQLITLSSPNRKRKLDEEKIKETILENDSRKLSKEMENSKTDNRVESDVEMEDKETTEGVKDEKQNENTNKEVQDKTEEKSERKEGEKDDQVKSDSAKSNVCVKEVPSPVRKTVTQSPASKVSSPTNRTVDFDLVLENTSDSILNPSFVEESPKGAKDNQSPAGNDFSKLSESLNSAKTDGAGDSSNVSTGASSGDVSKGTICPASRAASDLISPAKEKDGGDKHVFTPPRCAPSPSRGTPGRRIQLITLSSPKVKPKTQEK